MVSITVVFTLLLVMAGLSISFDKTANVRSFDKTTTDSLRGLLALLIIFHHVSLRIDIPIIGELGNASGIPLTALFFLLSGYGLCVSYLHKGQGYINGFLINRFSKILPSFLLLTIMAMVVRCFGKTLYTQIHDLVLHGNTPLPNSWFIYTIIYTYAAFYVSAFWGKKPKRIGIYLIGFNAIYITSYVLHYGFWWFVTISSVNLGYYIAVYENSLTKLLHRHPIVIYSVAIIVMLISAYGVEKTPGYVSESSLIWLSFWGLSFAVAGYLIVRGLGFPNWKSLAWCSAIAMEIYLIHGLPVLYLKTLFPGINAVLYVFMVYSFSLFAAWLLHYITNVKSIPSKKNGFV